MKIAILTLRVDNNYGGNLQRYALCRVLQDMGHEVTVLFFRSEWDKVNPLIRIKKMAKNIAKRCLNRPAAPIIYWNTETTAWNEIRESTFPFFKKYIPHSPLICSKQQLYNYTNKEQFDAVIVGSDQVWRKAYTQRWGIKHFFLDFVPNQTKKIAYSASFGQDHGEYTPEEVAFLSTLYKRFDAVSVRENSALHILNEYGWTIPQATQLLDPTLLLDASDYVRLAKVANTTSSPGNLFCYILDRTTDSDQVILTLSQNNNLTPFYASITGKNRMSVEQWLRSFIDAQYIVTDSYHGVVFSIIFNKPFTLLYNSNRGNARFESLLKLLEVDSHTHTHARTFAPNYSAVNDIITKERDRAKNFLRHSLT